MARLAAVYGFALAKEHCFADDSNGAALAIIDLILQLNGSELGASEPDAVVTIKALAADDLSEDGLTEWIAAQSRPVGDNP